MQKIVLTPFGKIEISTFGKKELVDLDFSQEDISSLITHRLSTLLNSDSSKIYGLKQIHGTDFFKAEESLQISVGDGLWTLKKDFILYVKTADCMPIFFWSNNFPLFGVLHSGWKGTRDGITEKLIKKLKVEFSDISLNFYLGPCIRQDEYEVKEDVSQFFDEKVLLRRDNKTFLGLENALLETIDERYHSFEDSKISSLSHPDYFSHRGKDTGRNLNVIRYVT